MQNRIQDHNEALLMSSKGCWPDTRSYQALLMSSKGCWIIYIIRWFTFDFDKYQGMMTWWPCNIHV